VYTVLEYEQDHVALMHAAEQALVHARAAGAGREEATARARIIGAALWGPEPAAKVAARCEEILNEAVGPALEAHARITLGVVRALQGDVAEARRLYARGRELFREVGLNLWAAGYTFPIGYAEFAAGELVRAEAELRRGADELEQMGQTGIRSSPIALLARIACLHGRDEEAEELVTESLAVSSDDELNQMICGGVRARITARRGDFDAAAALAVETLRDTANASGLALVKPDVYMDLAEVMRLAGRHDEEAAALREALRLYEQKGHVASASTVRSLLEGAPGTRR
jgi:ATP/maltotriose-dependent transcriptional regulator MalT